MTRLISYSEIKKHNNEKSCWIVIHNDVYDVTSYLAEHPGGEDPLLSTAGTDGTRDFEDVGHSDDAREIMKKFKIGSLPPGEIITESDAFDNSYKKMRKLSSSRPRYEGTNIIVYSCEHLPAIDKPEKTWRTYDGSSASRVSRSKSDLKSVYKTPSTPKIERRVQSIVVPKERCCRPRRRRGPPCSGGRRRSSVPAGGSGLKWAVLALASAVVIGFVIKKYLATTSWKSKLKWAILALAGAVVIGLVLNKYLAT
ncbi:uncharacterized protein [Epargyreus clarus]|uniref:uncharacterized protein n=1 Tax=Epargyreus clarus TaxID=520877 RepID=UPI003C2FE24B